MDLQTLDGTNGYVIDGVVLATGQAYGGGEGDINGDGIPDIAIARHAAASGGSRTFMLFGGSENLAALDLADGTEDGHIELSTFETAPDVTRGFVIDSRRPMRRATSMEIKSMT